MVSFAPTRARAGKSNATVAPDPEADDAGDAAEQGRASSQPGRPSSDGQGNSSGLPRKSSARKPGGLGDLTLPGDTSGGGSRGGGGGGDGTNVPSPPVTPAMSTPPAQTPGAHKRRASSVTNLFHRGSVGTLVTDLQVDLDVPNDTQLAIGYSHIKDDAFHYRGDDFEGKAVKDDRVYTRWHFYPHAFTIETLCVVVHRMFDRSGILNGVNAHDGRLIALISRTRELMYPHPFSSFQKSVDALQAAFMITEQPSVKDHLPPHDRLAILLAAFVHDVDHPGFSNEYVVAVEHAIVDQHGADGALKKHQASVANKLLESPDTNVLTRLGLEVANSIRARITELIVATDPAQHENVLKNARAAVGQAADGGTRAAAAPAVGGKKPTMSIATSEPDAPIATVENLVLAGHSLVVSQVILKAAVLATASRPPAVNERWACKMMKEHHRQGDYERKLPGAEVSAFCDRNADRNAIKCQITLGRESARPVYAMLADMAREAQPLLSLVDHNIERWEHVLDSSKHPVPRRASLGTRGVSDSPAKSPGILSAMRSPSKWAKSNSKAQHEASSSGLSVPGQTQMSTI